MKSIYFFIFGIFLIIQGSLINYLFTNPYPCMSTCIGCSSYIEFLNDSWTIYYLMIMLILGLFCFYKGVLNIEGKKK